VRRNTLRAFALALLLWPWCSSPAAAEGEPLPTLAELLGKMARVAGLYRDQALKFTCDETIRYHGQGWPLVHKFKYIYSYAPEGGGLRDYRTRQKRTSKKPGAEQQPERLDEFGFPEYVVRAYSWVFIFDEAVQPFFRFEIEGEDEVFGRAAIRLRFEAIPPFRNGINEWCGTVLIDRETYQPLLVEALQGDEYEQIERLERAVEADASPTESGFRGIFAFSTVTTEFDVEKNGMRFPGRVVIERTTHSVRDKAGKGSVRKTVVYRVIQLYTNYQFFGVRTTEQIQRIVGGLNPGTGVEHRPPR
jgi:hypothetical protein